MLVFDKKEETTYCVPLFVRDAQIKTNTRKVKGRVVPQENNANSIAIVGYAPSLNKTWKELKKFKHIITCSGAHKFLLSKGVVPTYHLDVDPRPHKLELLGEPDKRVLYLPASCVHPTYIDKLLERGCNINLWHVFARDGESEQVIPKGDWQITGGSDAGMRCMTVARILGYTDFHIFGMDGCDDPKSGRHADKHPNQAKGHSTTIYNGKTFQTTPALKECARQVFHELNQLPDVKFKFYGNGLIQEIAKTYVRKTIGESNIAAQLPELISDEMREQNKLLHEQNAWYGAGGAKYAETVIKMKTDTVHSVLDYGAGKQMLAKTLPFPIWSYDPAVPEIAESPRPADLVVCTDCLEHIEPDKLSHVLGDLRRCVLQIGYFVIHLGAAQKTYPNGSNTHLIQQPAEWWTKKLAQYFDIATAQQKGSELHIVVGLKTVQHNADAIVGIRGADGVKARFHIPNETTKWRAESLLSKEPVTIKWLENIPKDAVLYDVGANIGGYTCWAGVRGVDVVAFEPEAENYALLTKNIALNNLSTKAFCLAISDKSLIDTLHMSQRQLGGSCHSFGEAVGAFGEVRNGSHPEQACIGMSIDELIDKGLPKPDYIKIDVDGFEPKVIQGAVKTLKSVKSLIVEVNPALPTHVSMVKDLAKMGFVYDEEQVAVATRKEGQFKGVAEYVFFRQTAIERHVIKAVQDAELVFEPYPYFVMENVLPQKEYESLVASLPKKNKYVEIKKVRNLRGYPERFVADFTRPEWVDALGAAIQRKFGIVGEYTDETLLIKDKPNYHITPHTDVPARVFSFIMYLGTGVDGTVIYEPKKKGFQCKKGSHLPLDLFKKVKTIPYRGNTAFVFLRTDNSFHGVEKSKQERNVLLYDMRKQ